MNVVITDQSRNALLEGRGYSKIITMELPDANFVEILSACPDRGLQGATMVRSSSASLDRVLEAYIRRADLNFEDSHVKLVRDGLNEEILKGLFSTRADKGALKGDTDIALLRRYKSMLREHMTGDAYDLLPTLPSENRKMNIGPNITLLTAGNQEARVEAIRANYGLFGLFKQSEELRDRIDQKLPINNMIREHYGLNKDQFLAFRKICRTASTHLEDADGTIDEYSHHRRRKLTDTDGIAEVARLLRPDQIPAHCSDLMTVFGKLRTICEFAESAGLGDHFIERTLRPVLADQWNDLLKGAEKGGYHFDGGLRDYLSVTSTVMASSVVMNAFIGQEAGLLDMASETASDLLSTRDVGEADLDRMAGLIEKLERSDLAMLRNDVKAEIAKAFGRHANLKELRERSTRWHHVNQLLSSGVTSEGTDIIWEPLIGTMELTNARAVELTSSIKMAEQGVKENHCVGSYVNVVLNPPYNGAKAIFSLEDETGILSTAEVEVGKTYDDRGRPYYCARLLQHQAHSNTKPSSRAVSAVSELIDDLCELPQEALKSYVDSIKSNPHSLREKVGRIISGWGGNVFSDGFPKVALSTYQEVIPRKLRGGMDDLQDILGKDLMKRITGTVADVLAGRTPTEIPAPQPQLGPAMAKFLSSQEHRESTEWLGILLEEIGVHEFEVSLSGYGDSGAIDSYDFPGREVLDGDPFQKLERLHLPGTLKSVRDILDLKVERDATAEGNWYDNEGGSVWSKYVVTEGNLVADTVILTHNDPEDEDEEELDDEFEDELEP